MGSGGLEEGCKSECVNFACVGKFRGGELEIGEKEDTHNLTVPKTLLTFKFITFANASSGCVSNFSPHVAPAFANNISIWSVVLDTSETRCWIPSMVDMSAGTEMAFAPGERLGRALSVETAASQAEPLREVM